jgi:hypothetical protein
MFATQHGVTADDVDIQGEAKDCPEAFGTFISPNSR